MPINVGLVCSYSRRKKRSYAFA